MDVTHYLPSQYADRDGEPVGQRSREVLPPVVHVRLQVGHVDEQRQQRLDDDGRPGRHSQLVEGVVLVVRDAATELVAATADVVVRIFKQNGLEKCGRK